MTKQKRVNAYLASIQKETDEPAQLATVKKEAASPEVQNIPEEQIQTPKQVKQTPKGSSQKSGAEKTDHSDESRPEAPSSSGDQRSQTTLPQIIEKIPPKQVKKELKLKIENNENKNYHLKQVNFTVGKKRELKLDELAFIYTKQKEKRVNRNDIVRYLIDTISIEELLGIDLSKYEK